MASPPDPELIIAEEKALRDRQAPGHDAYIASDAYTHAIEDASFWMALGLAAEHVVLDAGCGTGRHLPGLLMRAATVIGVDHSEQSLAIARKRANTEDDRLRLVQADLRELPLEDDVVDRIMCCGVIQHVPTTEHRLQALRELGRVLRPGGLLVISAYRWLGHVKRHREGFWGENLYRYAFTAREFRDLVRSAGFQNVSVGGIAVLPSAARRLGVSIESQVRIGFTPIGRHLAHYVIARASKP